MDQSQLRRVLAHRLAAHGGPRGALSPMEMPAVLRDLADDVARRAGAPIDVPIEPLVTQLTHEAMLFGPLWRLMFDADVSEVMVNGPDRVFVERLGHQERVTEPLFRDDQAIRHVMDRMLQLDTSVRLDVSKPYTDLALPDGSRANFAIPPIVAHPTITIRKYQGTFRTMDDFVRAGTLDGRMATLLVAATRARLNVLFSGATASGKTTLLEVLSRTIPAHERLVCIEDTPELHFDHPNIVRMVARGPNFEGKGEITIGDMFRNSLRMAPDRVLLGEIRGREAYDYLQALNSGHAGSLAVIHAASPQEAAVRLQNLVPLAGLGLPSAVVKRQIAHGLDLVVQLEQGPDGVRRVTRITEVRDLDADGEPILVDLFAFAVDRTGPLELVGTFEATGEVPAFLPRLGRSGIEVGRSLFAKG